jgi:hypothetical protein
LSEEFIEYHLNEFNSLRQGCCMVPEYDAHFMEFLRYVAHLSTEKLKVNKFVMAQNISIHVKVRILMPQMLHNAFQKARISKEELIIRGQGRTPARSMKKGDAWCATTSGSTRTLSRYRDTSRGFTFTGYL